MFKRSPGFTLIELLIVVVIIAILASIAMVNFAQARIRANIARVEGDFKALDLCIETYRLDNDEYPGDYMHPRNRRPNGEANWDIRGQLSVLTTPIVYISTVPWKDPFYSPMRFQDNPTDPLVVAQMNRAPWYWYLNDGDHAYWRSFRQGDPNQPRDVWQEFPNHQGFTGGKNQPIPYLWLLNSYGPDQMWTAHMYHQIYDPSNGLRSRGDIWWFGPGVGLGRK